MRSKSNRPRRLALEQLENRRLLAINPTAEEQEEIQLINRFRTDPTGEFNRLFSSASPLTARDSTIQTDLDFFKVNGTTLKNEWSTLTAVPPVTWNEAVSNFAATHNNDMIAQNRLFHSDALARRTALLNAGVNLNTTSGETITSEIVFGQIKSALHNFVAYAVDWGTGSGGMQDGRTHRVALMNSVFEEIGGKLTATSASNIKPKVNTFVLANIQDPAVRVSGAVFNDLNNSTWYEAGEGLGGVSLSFESTDGRKHSTTSFSAGGYQIDLPAGTYKVRVSGGAMQHAMVRTVTVSDKSLWVNFAYKATDPAPDANELNDSTAFATAVAAPNATIPSMSLHTASDVDYYKYVPVGTGIATYELQFTNSNGDINLQLLNAAGQVLATSATSGNGESIQFQADAGTTYYLKVYGAANPSYTLKVTGSEAINPDAKEPNDTTATATVLTGASPTVTGLSLHTNRDIDLFKYVAQGTGQATFGLSFTHASGNIDLQLLDANGAVLATSAGTGNGESIVRAVTRSTTYYIKAYGGPNKSYSLSISGPSPQPPVATRDRATVTSEALTTTIAVLSNDSDPDGNRADLVPAFVGTPPREFTLNTDKTVTVRATSGFTGLLKTSYTVQDADGLKSAAANIEVFVVDFLRQWPWLNPQRPNDVSGDGIVTPTDALLVINFLNDELDNLLPTSGATNLFGFLDVRGDGRITPVDALLIINELNSRGTGEGESSIASVALANNDAAIEQLMAAPDPVIGVSYLDTVKRNRR